MKFIAYLSLLTIIFMAVTPASAAGLFADKSVEKEDVQSVLTPHKALYDINLVATRSGSQVINISGKMFYEWKPTCDAWITDHRFSLFYEYTDSPGMRITSDFSTFETFDGESFNFSARRSRNKDLYQELRGQATMEGLGTDIEADLEADKGGAAIFTMPDDLNFDLGKGAMFPMAHTVEMVQKARSDKKFFTAVVFDGSDDEGPVEINTFIGKPANAMKIVEPSKALDMTLLNTPAWNVRMAVFPTQNEEESSDYEMSMIFHENGIISDMLIEYDDFSVTQKLVALEKLEGEQCGSRKAPQASENSPKYNKERDQENQNKKQ